LRQNPIFMFRKKVRTVSSLSACQCRLFPREAWGLFKLPFSNNNNIKVSSAVKAASGKNLFEIINNSLEQFLLRLRLNSRTPPSFTFQRIYSQKQKKQTNFFALFFFLAKPQYSSIINDFFAFNKAFLCMKFFLFRLSQLFN